MGSSANARMGRGPGYQCERRTRSKAELMSVTQPGEVDDLPTCLLQIFKYKRRSPQKSHCDETLSMTRFWPSSSQPISVHPILEATTKLLVTELAKGLHHLTNPGFHREDVFFRSQSLYLEAQPSQSHPRSQPSVLNLQRPLHER